VSDDAGQAVVPEKLVKVFQMEPYRFGDARAFVSCFIQGRIRAAQFTSFASIAATYEGSL
jgi:hypothetical protein